MPTFKSGGPMEYSKRFLFLRSSLQSRETKKRRKCARTFFAAWSFFSSFVFLASLARKRKGLLARYRTKNEWFWNGAQSLPFETLRHSNSPEMPCAYCVRHCTHAHDFAYACWRLDCNCDWTKTKTNPKIQLGRSPRTARVVIGIAKTLTLLFILLYLNADVTMRVEGFTLLLCPKLYVCRKQAKIDVNPKMFSCFFFHYRQSLTNTLPM